jgi:hypothetical protein
MDLKLDNDGDLAIEGGGPVYVEDVEAIAQHLRIRLKMFLGEWKLNPLEGIPYYQRVLEKNPDSAVISVLFRKVILGTPGIKSLDDMELELDRSARTLTLSFAATATTGEPLVFDDFVLTL